MIYFLKNRIMGFFDRKYKKKTTKLKIVPKTGTESYFYHIFTEAGIFPSDENFSRFQKDLAPLYYEKLISYGYNALEKKEERQQFDDFIAHQADSQENLLIKIEGLINFVKSLNPQFKENLKEMEQEMTEDYLQGIEKITMMDMACDCCDDSIDYD